MPRHNPARRRALTDAAVTLLASDGVHGLTHRSAERAAGLPAGTASNYFRDREELLVGAAERIVELHLADMERADTAALRQAPDGSAPDVVALVASSLEAAASAQRDRYLAVFELTLESRRRPALAAALARLAGGASAFTAGQHADLGSDVPPRVAALLVTLYGGALFALVTAPGGPGTPTPHDLARAIVAGARSVA
ncbi:TetR/AcrR family transcriptional regulator [Promicromonospora citrea]|uniref:TetR family transcriptional regulator n=1 Tax=Promicromonospora citrea TaxID=43677 RepID=A0A8H9L8F6_9MICO|nr:TetR family transcriptional regulator [Promicromonospora citrea]NNH53514.1 TetR family transcriptional regulator [Promicromonospora citrea]GGM43112.1 TetR family transcriptional regulator [Promicromonospora citrea]